MRPDEFDTPAFQNKSSHGSNSALSYSIVLDFKLTIFRIIGYVMINLPCKSDLLRPQDTTAITSSAMLPRVLSFVLHLKYAKIKRSTVLFLLILKAPFSVLSSGQGQVQFMKNAHKVQNCSFYLQVQSG